MALAVRAANLERAADGYLSVTITVAMRHLPRETSLFSWTYEALSLLFAFAKRKEIVIVRREFC
jgi:hypothetical protein